MKEFIKENKLIIAVIGIVLVAALGYRVFRGGNDNGGEIVVQPPVKGQTGGGGPVKHEDKEPTDNGGSLPPPPPEPVAKSKTIERLPEKNKPQEIETILVTTGKGEDADWGVKGLCSFVLTYGVACRAEILEKSETEGGEIKVSEKRTYTRCRQRLEVSECDVQLDLFATLPLEETVKAAKIIGIGLTALGGGLYGKPISTAAGVLDFVAKQVDGKSVRGVLEEFNVNLPERMENRINEFVAKKLDERGDMLRVESLEGKSYRVEYFQSKESGMVRNVNFYYADGSEVTADNERRVLRRLNAFLVEDIIPDNVRDCKPGTQWTIDAERLDCLLDPYVDGTYSGEVKLVRNNDDADGDWRVSIQKARLAVVDEKEKTKMTGEVVIENGECKVDNANSILKAMKVSGACKLDELTEHHMLFKSRIAGWCEFGATFVTKADGK